MPASKNLLTSPLMVQAPVIQVKIGDYTFGMYEKDKDGFSRYPNYIQSLEIIKINGQVNTYTLTLIYPINEKSDPNYFEKVFSSVSRSRSIEFTYGDSSSPSFMYKKESALMTKVKSAFNLDTSSITYTVSAVSQAALGMSGGYSFGATTKQPSKVIKEVLQNSYYGLQSLFTGMTNMNLVNQYGLIPQNDLSVKIDKKDNISVLAYIEYLVSLMTPKAANAGNKNVFILTFCDDTSGILGGPYFKISEVDASIDHPEAYEVNIGYPGSNYVFNFNIENDENYSIYYEYQKKLHPQEYVSRINNDGDYEEVYAPLLSSTNNSHNTGESEKSWWAKVTQYPIKSSLVIKGLLRPAVLMSYVRLNILLYGNKHINSGLYIITKQVDKIDATSGYQTTLNLLRIGSD